jgi:hypothetical protein
MGDTGPQQDPQGHGQDLSTHLGLRIPRTLAVQLRSGHGRSMGRRCGTGSRGRSGHRALRGKSWLECVRRL